MISPRAADGIMALSIGDSQGIALALEAL